MQLPRLTGLRKLVITLPLDLDIQQHLMKVPLPPRPLQHPHLLLPQPPPDHPLKLLPALTFALSLSSFGPAQHRLEPVPASAPSACCETRPRQTSPRARRPCLVRRAAAAAGTRPSRPHRRRRLRSRAVISATPPAPAAALRTLLKFVFLDADGLARAAASAPAASTARRPPVVRPQRAPSSSVARSSRRPWPTATHRGAVPSPRRRRRRRRRRAGRGRGRARPGRRGAARVARRATQDHAHVVRLRRWRGPRPACSRSAARRRSRRRRRRGPWAGVVGRTRRSGPARSEGESAVTQASSAGRRLRSAGGAAEAVVSPVDGGSVAEVRLWWGRRAFALLGGLFVAFEGEGLDHGCGVCAGCRCSDFKAIGFSFSETEVSNTSQITWFRRPLNSIRKC